MFILFLKYFFIMTKTKVIKKSDHYIEAKFCARSIARGFRAIRATPREIRRVECSVPVEFFAENVAFWLQPLWGLSYVTKPIMLKTSTLHSTLRISRGVARIALKPCAIDRAYNFASIQWSDFFSNFFLVMMKKYFEKVSIEKIFFDFFLANFLKIDF